MNETLASSVLSDAPREIFWGILLFLITSALAYFFSKKVQIIVRTQKIKIFSETFRYNFFFKYYFLNKISDLDSEVFHEIKKEFKNFEIRKVSVRPGSITIYPEKLGTKVNIELDSVDELLSDEDIEVEVGAKKEYQLTVKLDSDIRLAYKQLNILEDYIALFEGIKNIVKQQCFEGERERKTFLVCNVIREIETTFDQEKIIDESKNLRVSFGKKNIKITMRDSIYLISTIKKYIGY